jgi:3'(2'), 5'-bisphosphate nucleotidase
MSLLNECISAARGAGQLALDIRKTAYNISTKHDRTLVTDADLAADKFITSALAHHNIPFLTEETADDVRRLSSGRLFLIDPIDGTQGFISGESEFAVMIGLVEDKLPVLGVIYDPVSDILYYAEKGSGAYMKKGTEKQQRLQVSDKSSLPDMCLVIPRHSRSFMPSTLVAHMGSKTILRYGSFGLRAMMIARGEADFFVVIPGVAALGSEWDTGAPEIILAEAGGKMTDIAGNPLLYNQKDVKKKEGILASNGQIHRLLLEKIASFKDGTAGNPQNP